MSVKQELNKIWPMVMYHWSIVKKDNIHYWEGDKKLPIDISTITNLINNGYVILENNTYKASKKLISLKCSYCYNGNIYYKDTNQVLNICPQCQGTSIDHEKCK